MIQVTSIKTYRDKNNKILGYRIKDLNGKEMDITSEKLKFAIANAQISVLNLTLTSDNRLVEKSTGDLEDLSMFTNDNIMTQIPRSNTAVKAIEYNKAADICFIHTWGNIIGTVMLQQVVSNKQFITNRHFQVGTSKTDISSSIQILGKTVEQSRDAIEKLYGNKPDLSILANYHDRVKAELNAIENALMKKSGQSVVNKEALSNIGKMKISELSKLLQSTSKNEVDDIITSKLDSIINGTYRNFSVDMPQFNDREMFSIGQKCRSEVIRMKYQMELKNIISSLAFKPLNKSLTAERNRTFDVRYGIYEMKREYIDNICKYKGFDYKVSDIVEAISKTFPDVKIKDCDNNVRNTVCICHSKTHNSKNNMTVGVLGSDTIRFATFSIQDAPLKDDKHMGRVPVFSAMAVLSGINSWLTPDLKIEDIKIQSAYDIKAVIYKLLYTRMHLWCLEDSFQTESDRPLFGLWPTNH